ncbi:MULTISPECIES: hypothetical protein [Mycobacteriaceae]|jgi:Mce-associated membrane protein|uniref:Mce protein n=2 Tax=Mycolicibacterium TaxID=1866885 RepID=A0A1A2VCY3_9MYCO|nr:MULTISPECIES: hypothetical protein [Mycobacteriaceae]MCF6391230.1 hypothetical protein [Mycobacterium sp. MBM]MCW1825060.1 hypothetical protein [Mycolicibacterium senegalense]OBB05830.1 hypothetical protein A5718_21775 [Mycolicibacterium conceptionense]OBF03761.1 hypothetical protein A5731_12400 [Mycolicibacterium conceptionense]OBF25141.1 hypothetical protein A5726_08015 [Mycolicibacterium conceptionense]
MFSRTRTKDVFDQINGSNDCDENEHSSGDKDVDQSPENHDAGEVTGVDPTDDPDDQHQSVDLDDPATESRLGRGSRTTLIGAVLLVALLLAVGTAAFFGWQVKRQHDLVATGREALAVANDYGVTLTSIDSAKVDENYAKVLQGATGEFKDLYTQSAAQLRQLLIDNKAVSHGVVVDSAVKSVTPDKVEVLLFIDQSISNAVNPEPRIDRSRVTIVLERIDNRWLASKVDIK